MYLTTDHLTFEIFLKNCENDEDQINIKFNLFDIRESINGKYNILVVIGRKQLYEGNLYNNNFIWISVADYLTSNTIISGYIDLSNIYEPNSKPIYIDNRYVFSKIIFNDLVLSKVDFYSKYNDFTNTVQEATPSDVGYKYEAAHITIRSVKTYEMLQSIKDQLMDNELIYCQANNKLYIISDNTIKNISTGSGSGTEDDTDMITNEQLLEKLKELNIITDDNSIVLNDIESIRFINTETNKKYDISVDSYGNLISTQFNPSKTLTFNINSQSEDNINKLLKCTNRDKVVEKVHSTANGYIDVRGFVSRYNDLMQNGAKSKIITYDNTNLGSSWKLDADRIKIGAVYCPTSNDDKISCTHAYVELENTSDKDFPLDGCYLHFDRPVINKSTGEVEFKVSHLALTGYIPKNGTYLVRGKQYRKPTDANVFINVNSYDIEWFDKETDNDLIDLTLNILDAAENNIYAFALTYQFDNLSHDDKLVIANDGTITDKTFNNAFDISKDDFPFLYVWNFIDAIAINKQNSWLPPSSAGAVFLMKSNSIYKNMFELDPAKQAFNSLNKKDSSRSRYQKTITDCQTLELSSGYITFPKTPEYKKLVSDYTPKASFEGKNVQTDKTKLKINKPNAVTVSFGTDIFKTRCFNWVSCGLYDEYVFLYDKDHNFVGKFESYKKIDTPITHDSNEAYPIRKEFPVNVNNVVYSSNEKSRLYDYFPADGTYYTSHKCIIDICSQAPSTPEVWTYKVARLAEVEIKNEISISDKNIENPDPNYCSEEMHFTMYPSTYTPQLYQITDQQGFHWQEYQAWAACAKKLNEVIDNEVKEYRQYNQQEVNEYNAQLEGAISINMINPDTQVNYTESEAIAFNSKLTGAISTNVINPNSGVNYTAEEVAEYNANHSDQISTDMINPDTQVNYTESEAIEFNSKLDGAVSTNMINPENEVNYTENEVNEFNSKLDGAISTNDYNTFYKGIMPILINTGDMTQSGARVSEWLDYYTAGECLFNHLEQMNIVGNNDLSPVSSVNDLGMGDDPDKSNAYFFHLFYCYEVNPIYLDADTKKENPIYPIVNNKYIPSLYYIDIQKLRLLFINSEITHDACNKWFKTSDSETGKVCNIYTGYATIQSGMTDAESPYLADKLNITPIYTMIYHMTEDSDKKYIAICHEMPFTVITRDSLYYEHKKDASADTSITAIDSYRSISPLKALVGCHMNQINKEDAGYGIYWFSRLMEYRNIKLVLGGHKHTYCVTYPLAENYKYTVDGTEKRSLINGRMPMSETLNNAIEKSIVWNWPNETMLDSNNIDTTQISYNANHTKLPLTMVSDTEITNRYNGESNNTFKIRKSQTAKGESIFLPCHIISEQWAADHNINPVIYFMCQATGYKLTSNKELPSAMQRFSQLLPATTITAKLADKASGHQQAPMYSTTKFDNLNTIGTDNCTAKFSIKLTRIRNVGVDNTNAAPPEWTFNQQQNNNKNIVLEYITINNSDLSDSTKIDSYNYGKWSNSENYLLNNKAL